MIITSIIALENMFIAMGTSFMEWIPSFRVDFSRSILYTTAILPPIDMLLLIIRCLLEGFLVFFIPHRNMKILGKTLLGNWGIEYYQRIPFKLQYSGETHAMMLFAGQPSDVPTITA
jgi:hypothetical protein